jgi:hypothetical protein
MKKQGSEQKCTEKAGRGALIRMGAAWFAAMSSSFPARQKKRGISTLIVIGEGLFGLMLLASSSSPQRPAWSPDCARCLPNLILNLSVDPGETTQVSQVRRRDGRPVRQGIDFNSTVFDHAPD